MQTNFKFELFNYDTPNSMELKSDRPVFTDLLTPQSYASDKPSPKPHLKSFSATKTVTGITQTFTAQRNNMFHWLE